MSRAGCVPGIMRFVGLQSLNWAICRLPHLAFKEYTKAIDMWSVGCILAEMSECEGEDLV